MWTPRRFASCGSGMSLRIGESGIPPPRPEIDGFMSRRILTPTPKRQRPEPACGPTRDSHPHSTVRALLFRFGCRFLSFWLHRGGRLRLPELRIPRRPLLRGITHLRVEREDVRLDGDVRVGCDRLELLGVLLPLGL